MKGTLARLDGSELTLSRKGLPPVKLCLAADADVRRGGEYARPADLQPGDAVRAAFDLENQKPIAVEVRARAQAERRPLTTRLSALLHPGRS